MIIPRSKYFLINAHLVQPVDYLMEKQQFEFILNEELNLLKSFQVQNVTPTNTFKITPIIKIEDLCRKLFELNHIKINPQFNNANIIKTLSHKFTQLGLKLEGIPSSKDLASYYQPLGKINHKIRFYLNETGNIIFLIPNKPQICKI